jgi:hypothetical protein
VIFFRDGFHGMVKVSVDLGWGFREGKIEAKGSNLSLQAV